MDYLGACRSRFGVIIEALTEDEARAPRAYGSSEFPFAELLLYTMRHVQHHVGQLNFILAQQADSAPRWVKRALP